MDATPAKPSYRRLPGRAPYFRFSRSGVVGSTLWMGPDHLLKIELRSSRENYKRFYFRDIQAIMVDETSRRYYLNVFTLLSIGLIVFLCLTLSRTALAGLSTAAILSAPFLIAFITNLFLGRTSQAVLVTAVGKESLPSLSRIDRAASAVQIISAEVEKVQGALSTASLLPYWPAAEAPPPTT